MSGRRQVLRCTGVRRAVWLGVVTALAGGWPAAARAAASSEDPPAIYRVDLRIDAPVIVAGAAAGIIPYAFTSRLIHPTCPCAASAVNAFDRGTIGNSSDAADWISSATVALTLVAPPLADWLALRRGRIWLDDAVVYAESLSVNGALVTAVKYAVQRPVPRAYTDPALAADPASYRSFYSGHAAFAFAALSVASVTADVRYGLTWQPWAITVAVGGSVAAEKVLAGYHFPTDVIAGAAAGTAVGVAVALLHLRSRGLRLSAFRPPLGEGAGLALAGFL